MKNLKHYCIILFLLPAFSISAQSVAFMDNWYFGWFASVNFSSGSPVPTIGSTMITSEGCASYSDNQGNLLFYTEGGKINTSFTSIGGVRNVNHQLMPNGEMNAGEGGCDSSPQSALIIPKSGSEYYLFTVGCANQPLGLKKSIVDMSLDGGLGDVTLKGDPVPGLSNFLAEGMTASKHANGTDHWLIVHSSGGNSYYVFLVTPNGVSGPTTYNVGTGSNFGQIKVNVQGDRIAFNTEVLDFDNATGEISNPISLGTESFWGRAFSATGDYLYMRTIVGDLFQFDMNASDISSSSTLISSVLSAAGNLQLGPDLKIYGTSNGNGYLSAITQPEVSGTGCNYIQNHLLLGGNSDCQMGLPNFIDSDLRFLLSTDEVDKENVLNGFFPNPANHELNFKIQLIKKDLSISTLEGRIVRNWDLVGKSLKIQDFEPGVYVMNYRGSVSRFIKL